MSAPDPGTLAPPGRVLLPLLAGAALELVAWSWLWPAEALQGGWLGRVELLRAVHTLALGTLGLSLLGASWQIVPVITARPWPARLAPGVNGALGLGLLGMLWGFAHPGWVGVAGVALVALALWGRAGGVLLSLARARGRGAVRTWIAGAELCGLTGLGLGLLLWAGRSGHPVLRDPIWGIGRHLGLMVGGLFGGWMVGAGAVLLPMFAVAKEPSPRALYAGAVAWFGGVLLGLPLLWALGAALSVGALLRSLSQGARRGPALGQAAFGLVGGLLSGVCLGVFGAAAGQGAPVVALFALGLLPVLRGVAQRIGPFFAWSYAARGSIRGAPPVARFAPEGWMWAQAALSLPGGALLVASRTWGELARPALALLLLGAGVQLAILGRAAIFAALLAWPTGGKDVADRQV